MRCKPGCHCPNCDSEMAAVMRMTPEQYSGWLTITQRRMVRAAGGSSFRTSAGERDVYLNPPDPYEADIAKLRAGMASVPGESEIVRDEDGIPDGYATALARRAARGGAR